MAHMTRLMPGIIVQLWSSDSRQVWGTYKCDNCNAVSLATSQASKNETVDERTPAIWIERKADAEWYPTPTVVGKEFPDVPQHIAEAASEAYKCRSISAFRAAALLARSVIEAIAKDKGVIQGNLMSKIDELFNQRFIREHIRDGAHEVRFLGDEMAHGDFISSITDEERELALILMSEIIEEVYQSPARVARARAARTARHDQLSDSQPNHYARADA